MSLRTKAKKNSKEYKTVVKMVNKCLRHLSRKEYGIIRNYASAKGVAESILEVYPDYVRSRAGSSRIMISTHRSNFGYMENKGVFVEYAAFNDHPTIGKFKGTPIDCLFALVAHEVSDHVQYRYLRYDPRYRHMYSKPHGDGFKLIYNILRRDLVNPLGG